MDASCLTTELTGLSENDLYFVRVFSENQAGVCKKPCELSEPISAKKPLREFSLDQSLTGEWGWEGKRGSWERNSTVAIEVVQTPLLRWIIFINPLILSRITGLKYDLCKLP